MAINWQIKGWKIFLLIFHRDNVHLRVLICKWQWTFVGVPRRQRNWGNGMEKTPSDKEEARWAEDEQRDVLLMWEK